MSVSSVWCVQGNCVDTYNDIRIYNNKPQGLFEWTGLNNKAATLLFNEVGTETLTRAKANNTDQVAVPQSLLV